MPRLKAKEIKKMSKEEREKKLKELALELIKSRVSSSKSGSSKTREIKKLIARIKTTNAQENKQIKKSK